MGRGLRLEELEVYKIAMEIGEMAWAVVNTWNDFDKNSLGNQLVRAADSMALNISEGYGRYHYKVNKNFCYYSRGSAKETLTAIAKARNRNLIAEEDFLLFSAKLDSYFRLANAYINSIGTRKNED